MTEQDILFNLSEMAEAMIVLYGEEFSARDFSDNLHRQMKSGKGVCGAIPNTKESWHMASVVYRDTLLSRENRPAEGRLELAHIKRSFGIWNGEVRLVIGDPNK